MKQANIYLRKDGRWEGRIFTGKKNGKRQYQAFFGKTREIVEQKILAYRSKNVANASYKIQFSTMLTEWLHSVQYRVKESTAANYRLKANKHLLPSFGNTDISKITQDDIYLFITDKQNEGLSNRYISDIVIMLKSVFKYATRLYHVANPMEGIVMPKKQKPDIRLLDNGEQSNLHQYIANNLNLTTMGIALTMATGLRIGELCALQWKDIDLKKRILTVSKTVQRIQCRNVNHKTKLIITDPKSESSKRDIPIPDFLIGLLKKFCQKPTDYLISGKEKPTEPRVMQYRFAKILKNGNLPSVHFHSLRHLFASSCIKLGFDVKALSEILGHSSVEVTLNRYVHSSFKQKTEYMNRLRFEI